jgi:hypothetical protein
MAGIFHLVAINVEFQILDELPRLALQTLVTTRPVYTALNPVSYSEASSLSQDKGKYL